MKIEGKNELREKLAAEYVLGTLQGGARRRFETWMRSDAGLRVLVAKWNDGLAPLAENLPEQTPPPRVWNAIVARIPAFGASQKTQTGWWHSLAFWRGLALATTAAAVFAIGLNVLRGPAPVQVQQVAVLPSVVATITDDKTGEPLAFLMIPAQLNVPGAPATSELVVKVVANVNVPNDKTLQLWMAPKIPVPGAPPVNSVGLVNASARTLPLRMTIADIQALHEARLLGLSIEPAGGSPQPTQVIGHGKWTRVTS